MCLFPKKATNNRFISEYECGVCPECLHKRSSQWALRVYGEYKTNPVGMALCLTYDQYIRDSRGRIVGEKTASDMVVSKVDAQKFIKRLRKYISDNVPGNPKIKYIITSEYGKRTHRPHYHVIIMGYCFDDCRFYKKSKRGNVIYQSAKLNSIWKNGICSVDAVKLSPSIARYCTKYSMKDKGVDTFSLMSRGIGREWLHSNFNWRSYFVEGHEHPIPRLIIQERSYAEILDRFCRVYRPLTPISFKSFAKARYRCYPRLISKQRVTPSSFTYKYVKDSFENKRRRALFSRLKRRLPSYKGYLSYWKKKAEQFSSARLSPLQRLQALPPKYEMYVHACRLYLTEREHTPFRFPVPRGNENLDFRKSVMEYYHLHKYCPESVVRRYLDLALSSRHKAPNDTEYFKGLVVLPDDGLNPFDNPEFYSPPVSLPGDGDQISMF